MKKSFQFFGLLAMVMMFSFSSFAQQCFYDDEFPLGNGNDGEAIANNPNDGLVYHASGLTAGNEFFETVDPNTGVVGPNIIPGDTYPGIFNNEITALAWYPPLNAFIGMNRDAEIFSLTTGGTFTLLSIYNGNGAFGYMRGFAVVGTDVYAISPDSGDDFL